MQNDRLGTCRSCADIGGGWDWTPLGFPKLTNPDNPGKEKKSNLSNMAPSAVDHQTQPHKQKRQRRKGAGGGGGGGGGTREGPTLSKKKPITHTGILVI